jgi:nicotinamide riboside transporter PnuC
MDALTIQLIASALSLAGQWFYGNKSKWGPMLGLAAQVPWWIIMFQSELWGLIPINASMLAIHIRNLYKWAKD